LVAETATRSATAGQWLGGVLVEALSKPWTREEFGDDRLDHIAHAIQRTLK
jgi:hypothetical protein